MKTIPAAVTIGPPRFGEPGKPPIVPRGTFQAMPPVVRFTATREPKGGGVHGSESVPFIYSHAAPMGAANVAGLRKRALRAGWRKRSLVAQRRQDVVAGGLGLWCGPPGVVRRIPERDEGRRNGRKGLRQRRNFAGNGARRNRPFLYGEDRRPSRSVEHVQHP